MRLIINKTALIHNMNKAKALVKTSAISVMLKSFYQYVHHELPVNTLIFSKSLPGSVCYSIGEANEKHSGSLVINTKDVRKCFHTHGIKKFYIPINAGDNREGLTVQDAIEFAEWIKRSTHIKPIGLITSGCINDSHFTTEEIRRIWAKGLAANFDGISLGGSFYLQKEIPEMVSDVRIGEYLLFGTIPYNNNVSLNGRNALIVELDVIAVYKERKQILVRGGYRSINTKESSLISGGLTFDNYSSEYTIYNDPFDMYDVGDKVMLVPNYKSLITLENVERYYQK